MTQHLSARLNLLGAGRWPEGIGRLEQLDVGFFSQRFRGDFNLHRPRSAGLELAEGLMHSGRHVLGLQDACGPLRDRTNGVHLIVHFMQHASVHANEIALNLSRYHQDR